MTMWVALNARARGLSSRLLGRSVLARLAAVADVRALARALDEAGYPGASGEAQQPRDLERRVRRVAAARLRVLARWGTELSGPLRVLFEDEDRRSLQSIVRGAVGGVDAETRLAPAIPTPLLPERALQELAAQPAPAGVAALLMIWDNPYGPPILAEARRPEPDLLALEYDIHRTFFRRALDGARRDGRELVRYVEALIDLENAWSAFALSGREEEATRDYFLEGGRRLDREIFLSVAVARGDSSTTREALRRAFQGSPLERIFGVAAPDLTRLDDAALAVLLEGWRRSSRSEPLGPGPSLAYALRLRAESRDLRRLIWGLSLGGPESMRVEELVSA